MTLTKEEEVRLVEINLLNEYEIETLSKQELVEYVELLRTEVWDDISRRSKTITT